MSGPQDTPQGPRPDAQPPARIGGWTRAILIGSLVLNLVLIGAIVGAGVSHRMPPPDRRGALDSGLGLLTDALPDADRRALRRDMIDHLRADGARARMVADTTELLATLRQEPFDRAAVADLFARQRGRAEGLLEAGSDRLLDRLAAMTPADRAAFADRLEQSIRHRVMDGPGG